MLRKVVFVAVIALIVTLTVGATFKQKTWTGSNFPYIGAYFCHNDDYVRFNCTEEMNRFYYMTAKDRDAYVEFYVDGKRQGTVHVLPANKWNQEHFAYANWKHFDFQGSSYIGHVIEIHFRENTTVNGIWCPENDIMIKLADNSKALLWKNVDSDNYCDLDDVAK